MIKKIKDTIEENEDFLAIAAVYGGASVILTALTTLAHFGIKKLLNVR